MKLFNKNKGFTLIETMMAIAVLSIIVLVFSGSFSSGIRSIKQSRDEIEALHKAQSVLENKIALNSSDRNQKLNLIFENDKSIEVFGSVIEKNGVRTFLPAD